MKHISYKNLEEHFIVPKYIRLDPNGCAMRLNDPNMMIHLNKMKLSPNIGEMVGFGVLILE